MTKLFTTVICIVSFHITAFAEEVPGPLSSAFSIMEKHFGKEMIEILKAKDPDKLRSGNIGYQFEDWIDIKNVSFPIPENFPTKAYDSVGEELVGETESILSLAPYAPMANYMPRYPKLQDFFAAYLVYDSTRRAQLLLELYVRHLRGMPLNWEKYLIEDRIFNLGVIEGGWHMQMHDLRLLDPIVAKKLLAELRKSLEAAEKKLAEQGGGSRDDH